MIIETRYVNKFGEVITLKYDGEEIIWHHQDVHKDEDYHSIKSIEDVVVDKDERVVIKAFISLCRAVKNER